MVNEPWFNSRGRTMVEPRSKNGSTMVEPWYFGTLKVSYSQKNFICSVFIFFSCLLLVVVYQFKKRFFNFYFSFSY